MPEAEVAVRAQQNLRISQLSAAGDPSVAFPPGCTVTF